MEGGLYAQQCKGNHIPQNYRHQHIPGIDHLCMQASEIITAKCHAVVNQYAKPQMLCEAYGVSGQNLSFADRWWMGLHMLSLGVTLFIPHLCLFTLAGCRKRDFPPNLFFQQPWWPVNHAVDEPLTRLCAALSQGRCVAEALVLHPQESAAALFRVRADWANPASLVTDDNIADAAGRERIDRLDADLRHVATALLAAQRVFDLGDEVILRDAGSVERAADGSALLRVGEMRYPAVVLPSLVTIAESTFRLLREFHDAGGPILLAGDEPTLVEGRPSDELHKLLSACRRVAPTEVSAGLPNPLVRLDTSADVSDVFVQVRDLHDGDRLVFLADRRRQGDPITANLTLAGDFAAVHRLDPTTGDDSLLADQLVLPLTFYPASCHLLRLSSQAAAGSPPPRHNHPQSAQVVPLPADHWQVERLDDNALTLDNAVWKESGFDDFTPHPIPVIAIQGRLDELRYRGPLSLRYTFRVDGLTLGRKVHLIVEYAERYRITVNGKVVQPSGLPPYLGDFRFSRIDVRSVVVPGTNTVDLSIDDFQFADPLAPTSDQPARTGTEIEAIYIVGDFGVRGRLTEEGPNPVTKMLPFGEYSAETHALIRMTYTAADSLCITDPAVLRLGDVVPQGLPFYAGRLRVRAMVHESLVTRYWTLRFSELDATVASVEVDGKPANYVFAEPLCIPIAAGARTVMITLFSSLRNLLGPHHHSSGETVNVAPWFFMPYCGEGKARADNTLAWSKGDFRSSNHRDSYASVSFGRLGVVEAILPTDQRDAG